MMLRLRAWVQEPEQQPPALLSYPFPELGFAPRTGQDQ
jgi:hypothetical protein